MSYIMVTTKAVADAMRENRVAAVRIMYDGKEVILFGVSHCMTRLHQGNTFYTPDGSTFEEYWSNELAVTGWI